MIIVSNANDTSEVYATPAEFPLELVLGDESSESTLEVYDTPLEEAPVEAASPDWSGSLVVDDALVPIEFVPVYSSETPEKADNASANEVLVETTSVGSSETPEEINNTCANKVLIETLPVYPNETLEVDDAYAVEVLAETTPVSYYSEISEAVHATPVEENLELESKPVELEVNRIHIHA